MKDYEVIYEMNLDCLQEVVNSYLAEGFLLAGGIDKSIDTDGSLVYLQAVYKAA